MARKWFRLVDVDGNAVTSAASVYVDIEDVDAFLWEVKQEYSDSYLAEIAPSDLSVFENRAAMEALAEDASIESLGGPENDALIVQVPTQRRVGWDEQPPHKKIRTSTVIEDEILKSIRQNLDIDEWHVGGIDLNIHKVESDFLNGSTFERNHWISSRYSKT